MTTQTLITAAEFEEMADRLGPCELVRGEVVTMSPAGMPHSRITAKMVVRLERWAEESGQGRTMAGGLGVIVERGPDTVREADVAYYSYRRLGREESPEGFSPVPPNLIVEIVSPRQGWRKVVRKAGEYLQMGVDRVWIFDPSSRRVHVYRPDAEPVVLNAGDTLCDDDVLPGFQCGVSEIFSD